MPHNGGDTSKASSPGRPRHQITRSISEISSPVRLHRHQSHRAARDPERDARTPAPQSAFPAVQGQRSLEWSRSEGATPNNLTPSASRRTSVLYASADEMMPPPTAAPEESGPTLGLAEEQQRAAARESALQQSLTEVGSFASSTTKQLDEVCSSLQEKMNALQDMVVALRELAEQCRQLNSSFSAETDELVADINSQLGAFGQFDDQQKRIESLQSRIHARRELINSLSQRVDAVRERIEGWERADREWQEKTRKRLKVVWVVTSVFFLVLLLLLGAHYAPGTLDETAASGGRLDTHGQAAASKADLQFNSADANPQRITWPLNRTENPSVSPISTDVLQVFDEL